MKTIITALIVVALGAGVYVYLESKKQSDEGSMVVCTMDAKMCPDGSYVGRTGPKCEFQACPGASADIEISL